MKKYFALFFWASSIINTHAQILGNLDSVNPNTATQSQTLTTTITQVAGSYMFGSPPCDNHGIFLLQGIDTIFCNFYNWQWLDVVDAEFTIPAAAQLGFYDLYVASTHYDWWMGTCTTLGYWVLYNGFEVTTNTGIHDIGNGEINPVIYPNPISEIGILNFSNKESKQYELSVMDSYGRIVFSEIVSSSHVSLTSKDLEAGIYYYSLNGQENNETFTGKFVIVE